MASQMQTQQIPDRVGSSSSQGAHFAELEQHSYLLCSAGQNLKRVGFPEVRYNPEENLEG